jgi:hypothetical protein
MAPADDEFNGTKKNASVGITVVSIIVWSQSYIT